MMLSALPLVAALTLAGGFGEPPASARPHTWFHLMNGNVSKQALTEEFEALVAAGIGGVQMFDAGCSIPAGEMRFASEEWFDFLEHAAREAKRLGLEMTLPNCSGWSSSGGPWVAPSNGMKKVVFGRAEVRAGETFRGVVPKGEDRNGYYRDLALLAVPVAKPVEDGTYAGFSYRLEFPHIWSSFAHLKTEVTEDGVSWKTIDERDFPLTIAGRGTHGRRYRAFPRPLRVKDIRLSGTFEKEQNVNPGRYPMEAKIADVKLERRLEISGLDAKVFAVRGYIEPDVPEVTRAEDTVARSQIVDLTSRMAADGSLEWRAPSGCDWQLLRFGFTANGSRNHPASKYGVGLEVDKLCAAALEDHFEKYVGRLCRRLGPLAGGDSGFNGCLVDSYEVGSQNWTDGFEREFRRRRGYDLMPYLPAFAGFIVDSAAATEKVLADFRRTIADMFAENYAGALARKCHEYKLKLSLEPYGSGPFDNLQYGSRADIPMAEFWSQSRKPRYRCVAGNARLAGYVAHVWGRRIVGAEAFTAHPGHSGAWLSTPDLLKPIGDAAYADGVNRIIYHRFVHQPFDRRHSKPGLTLGHWGMHFDRFNTWWPFVKEFTAYQSRCQWMLQEGEKVADVLFYCGAEAPNQGGNTDGAGESPYFAPYGWDWDVCETEALNRLVRRDGKLVVPGGAEYSLLVMPGEGRPSAGRLKSLGIEPDVATASEKRPKWIHRRNAEADWYFVCRNNSEREVLEVSFRQTGRIPEIWDPEKGTRRRARDFRDDGRRTAVKIDFGICGSRFIVFPKRADSQLPPERVAEYGAAGELDGEWKVTFPIGWYSDSAETKSATMPSLKSWTELADDDLKYFSGTATYEFKPRRLPIVRYGRWELDLGEVREMAEVFVNGKRSAALWKPPYRFEGEGAVTSLVIRVTNLWPNRLIGDDRLPADVEWKIEKNGKGPVKAIPEWLKRGEKSPTGRHSFTTWRHWTKDDALLPSGLLGCEGKLLVREVAP